MLPKRIVRFLKFFDICGFNTQLTNLSSNTNITYLISSVHVLMAASFTIHELFFFHKFYDSAGLIETINELIECFASLLTYYFIIFDSIFHRQAHLSFWTLFQRSNNKALVPRGYVFKIVEFFSANIVIDFITVGYYRFGGYVDFVAVLVYVAYMIPVKICQIRLFYYIFCLEMILFQLKIIEVELKSLAIKTNYDLTKWMRHFEHVHELIQLTNEIFDLSQVSTVLFCFHVLFTDMNYLYIHYYELSTARIIREQCKSFLVFFIIIKYIRLDFIFS